MKIGVLGTGMVGTAIASKLVSGGQEVMMGSRKRGSEKSAAWAASAGANASEGSFADAAAFGEALFNCTAGVASLSALKQAGAANLANKILIDLANPLDFSKGMPPTLTVCNTDSLGEQIQRAFSDCRVVKTLNTMNCFVMVDPSLVPGDHNVFVSGNDGAAKAQVAEWLCAWFGWKRSSFIDLGDISSARGTEMTLPLWIRLFGAIGHSNINYHIEIGKPVRH